MNLLSIKRFMTTPLLRLFFSFLFVLLLTVASADNYRHRNRRVFYEDFNLYVAPQLARVKMQIEGLATFRGVMEGGSFGFEYRPVWKIYAGATSEWMMGSCDAKQQMSRYIHDFDSQIRFGYTMAIWNYRKMTLTPFSGLGFQHVVQHIRPDTVLPSLKYNYYSYYIPVGAILNVRLSKQFGFALAGEWKPVINERLKEPYLHGIEFNLKKQAGYEFEVPFNFYFGNKVKGLFAIVPYLKRTVDGELSAGTPNGATIRLPQQNYKFWGMKLDFGLAF